MEPRWRSFKEFVALLQMLNAEKFRWKDLKSNFQKRKYSVTAVKFHIARPNVLYTTSIHRQNVKLNNFFIALRNSKSASSSIISALKYFSFFQNSAATPLHTTQENERSANFRRWDITICPTIVARSRQKFQAHFSKKIWLV